MDQSERLESIQTGYGLFKALLDQLPPDQLTVPGVVGHWSVKDILVHIVVHEQRMIAWVSATLRGESPCGPQPYGLPEEPLAVINDQIYQENRDRRWEDLISALAEVHAQSLALVQQAQESDLIDPRRFNLEGGEPLWAAVAANTFEHYEEHARDIRRGLMESSLKQYTEGNRAAWNEVMPLHQKAAREKWDLAFMQPGFVCMDPDEVAAFERVGIKGKAVAHLCCNNGVELLSLKNLGAGECVGFDISDLAIQEAQQRARKSQIDCQYVRTDVYEIGAEYENRFDVIYFSPGALGWLPDLKLLFAKAAALLRAGGQVFIYEIHPFSEMLPFDDFEGDDILRIIEPYFKADPHVDYGGLDYVGGAQYESAHPQYWFIHKISDILMGLIENRIEIQYFCESEKDISAGHQRIEKAQAGIPLSYLLIGSK